MNKGLFKIVFSKRLNALVVVGETVSSASRSCASGGVLGGSSSRVRHLTLSAIFSLLFCGSVFSAPATSALPTGGVVAQGRATVSQSGNTMTITQSSDKAVINFQSFDIAAGARVNIVQPSAKSIQLDRVIGNNPSQIMGQLVSNGQVMLVNPNGIVVGKDGSVSASGFTASSYGISDADFMAGKNRFERNATSAGVRNDGRIQTTAEGYVVLIGAEVINNGLIIAPQGNVVMAAGESVVIPGQMMAVESANESANNISVPLSARVRVSVSAARINTAVTNTKDGVIVTDGGQVLLQAAAVSDAVASVTHSGKIDTSGNRAGNVAILADHGNITVDGSIAANSKVAGVVPTNIIIGRDVDTNVLASNTNASGAKIQAKGGFVETSAETLKLDGARVEASTWLLDPNDIVIGTTATTGGTLTAAQAANGTSYILASDVSTALTAGTNVIISTSSSATGGNGDITVNTAISNTAAGNTLTLNAGRNIVLNSGITASNISLNAATGSVSGYGSLSATGQIKVNTATAGILYGLISGTAGLTKSGAGTLTLKGNNTYTGATSIQAGTLSITTANAAYASATSVGSLYSSSAFDIASGATLDFNLPLNASSNGRGATFTGAGTLTKTGGGELFWGIGPTVFNLGVGSQIDVQSGTLTASSSYAGNWTNNKSHLNIGTGATFNTSEAAVQVDSLTGNGTLAMGWTTLGGVTVGVNNMAAGAFNAAGTSVFSGVISSNAGVTTGSTLTIAPGTSTQVLTGTNTFVGQATIGSGSTLQVGNGALAGTLGAGAVVNNGTLSFNRTDPIGTPLVVSNAISGSGKVLQQGTGNIKLMSTANTFSGGMTISGGAVIIGNGNATPNYNLAAGTGAITLGDANTGSKNVALYLDRGMNASQIGLTRDINVTNNGTGTATIGGLLTNTSGTGWTIYQGKIALNKNVTIYDGTGDRVGLDSFITGAGNITLVGRATVSNGIQNNYVGDFTVNSGSTLQMNSGVGLSASNNVINNGTWRMLAGTTQTINALSGNGTISTFAVAGSTAVNLSIGNGGGSGVYTGTITGTSPVLNLIKNGSGTETLTGANTYVGTTTVNGGSLQIGSGAASGTLGTGAVTVNAAGALSFNRSDAFTVANNISGAGTVSQNGTGAGTTSAVTLTGDLSAETGIFNANYGTLNFSSAVSSRRFNGSAININNGSTVRITGVTGNFYAFGTNWNFDSNGGGTITASSPVNWVTGFGTTLATNTFNTNGGATNTISGASTAGLNTGVASNNTIFNVAPGASTVGLNVSSDLWNTGSITKTGAGLMTLTGATQSSNFSSAVAVNGGTLQVGDGTSTGYLGSGAVTLANGATLSYVRGVNTTISNAISGNGNVLANIVGTLTDSSPINLTSGSINLNATGNIALNANMTAAGSGGISVTAGNSAASTSTIVATAGATLTQSSGSGNITLTTTGTGDLTVPKIVDNGSGNVILAAGSMLSVGNTNGNIKTVAGNSVTLSGSDKLFVYSGSQSSTGALSVLNSGFSTLYAAGSGYTTNAQVSTAYGTSPNTITGGANTQVLFRDTVAPTYSLTLNNMTKTYGQADPTGLFTAVGNPTNLTTTVGNNTYGMLTSLAIGGLSTPASSGRVAGETVGSYKYSSVTQSLSNVILTSAPSLVINKANLTISANAINSIYNGVSTYQDMATATGFSSSGLVSGTVNGVAINDSISGVSSTFAGAGVAQAGDAARSISVAVGSGLTNYNINYVGGTGTVAKADLTLTGGTTSVTYDGSVQSNTFALASLQGAAINANNGLGADSLTITGAASGRNVNVGGYTDNLQVAAGAGTTLSNYNIVTTNGSMMINAAALNLTASTDTKTYDGNTLSSGTVAYGTGAGASTLFGTDTVTGLTQSFASKNVMGTNLSTLKVTGYTVNDGNGGNNYLINRTDAQGTITPKVLTASLTGTVSKVYDGNTAATLAPANIAVSGAVLGESFLVVGSAGVIATYADPNVTMNNGSGVVNASGLSMLNLIAGAGTNLNNYALSSSSASGNVGSITPKSLTLNGLTVNNKVYDANTSATLSSAGTLTGVVGTDAVAVGGLSVSFGNADAANNKAITLTHTGLTGAAASNYSLNPVASTTASISKANLTISGVTGYERTYTGLTDVVLDTGSVVIGGLKGADNFNFVAGNGNYLTPYAGVGKSLTITGQALLPIGSSSLNNYNVSYQTTGTGTVLKAPITAVIDNKTTTYGTVGALTYSVSGLVNGETASSAGISITGLSSTGYTSPSTTNSVGNYAITATSVGSQNYTNYTLSAITPGTLSITPATLTFTADGNSKLVTQADPTLTYSVSGLVNGDTAGVYTGPTISRVAGETAGNYAISLTGGNAGPNYIVSNVVPATSRFKILGAQTLLVTLNDVTTTYGTLGFSTIKNVQYLDANGTSFKTLTNTIGATWSDGVGGSINIYSGLLGVNQYTGVGAYANSVVAGTNGTVNANGNFTSVSTQTATYNVTKAALTVAANSVGRVYDGSYFNAPTATITGLMNGETATSLGGLTYSGDAINSRNVGTYTINANAATPGNWNNYNIAYQPGTLTTSQAYLSLSGLVVNNKVYDGGTAATLASTGTLTGVVAGDNVNLVTPVATFATPGAGLFKTVNLSGLSLTGNEAANYTLVNSSSVGPSLVYTANITPKTVTASGVTAQDKVYDTNANASLNTSGFTLAGVLAADQVYVNGTTSGLTGTFDSPNAGTGKTVTISGYGLSGSLASNYAFTPGYTTTTLANIEKAQAYITTASSTSGNVYNRTAYMLNLPVMTGVYASDLPAVTFTQTHNSAINAGSYTTVTTTGGVASTLNNYNFNITEGTLVIDRANLVVSATPGSGVVFNGAYQTQGKSITGLVSGDTITVNGLVHERNAGAYSSSLALGGSATTLGNYNVTLNDASFNIAQAQITSNTGSSSVTYNGAAQSLAAPTVSGIIGGTAVAVAQTGTSRTNVGSTTSVTTLTGIDAGNYQLSSASTEGTLSVGQANVGITINSATSTYDGNVIQTSGYTVSSGTVFGTDNLGVSGDLISARNAGTYYSTAIASNANYHVSITDGSLLINKANLTLSAASDTKVYDRTTTSGASVVIGNLGVGDSISGLSQSFALQHVLGANGSTINVNSGFVINDGNSGMNYNAPVLASAAGTITPALITVSASSDTKVYDGGVASVATPIKTAGTVFTGDTLTLNGQTFASKNVQGASGSTLNANAVTIADGNSGNNYAVTYQSAQGTITKSGITIQAASDTKTYDGNADSLAGPTLVAGSIKTGDSLSMNGQTFNSPNVQGLGASVMNANAVNLNDGNSGNNYAVTYQTNSGTINPLATTVTIASNPSSTYTGYMQTVTGHTISNLVAGDSLNVTGDTINGQNVGVYRSTATASNANYDISIVQGTLGITPAPLIVSANAGVGLVFNGSTQTQTASVAGLLGSDAVVLAGLVSERNAGTYTSNLNLSGSDATTLGNYSVALNNASFDIAKASLSTVTGSSTFTYNGATQSLAAPVVTGVLSNTSVAVTQTGNAARNAGTSTSVSSLSGADASNYTLAAVEGTLTINQAPLTLTAVADTKVYDATSASSQAVLVSGLQSGDAVTATQTFNAPGVLAANATQVASYSISDGNGGANYNVSTASATGVITPAAVTIGGVTAKDKTYDATTSVVLDTSAMTTVGVVDGESINTAVTGQFVTASVGAAKPVNLAMINTAGGLTDLSNYTITNQNSTTANINAVPVSPQPVVNPVVYPTPAPTPNPTPVVQPTTSIPATASSSSTSLLNSMGQIAPAASAPSSRSAAGSVKTGALSTGMGQSSPFALSSLEANTCSTNLPGDNCECEEYGNDLQICQVPLKNSISGAE